MNSEMRRRPDLRVLRSAMVAVCVPVYVVCAALASAAEIDAGALHAPFDEILGRHVDDRGRVAYRDLEKESGERLRGYLGALADVDPEGLDKGEKVAFWINAYNAHVINGVLNGYSAEGILGRKRFFSWYTFRLAGADRTLGEIEHEILRADFDEPRVHFALVCASTSCPVLRDEAYVGEKLDVQLDDQARRFVEDASRNRIVKDAIAISRIFEWFADDFEKAAGSVPAFIRRYRTVPKGAPVSYLEYDWTMNAQPGQRPG